MSDPLIRGWCPGALRPMASGDGLVVRVRPPMGRLRSAQAHGLGAVAQAYGRGVIEMTTRANLQIRGVAETALPALWSDLRALDLLDDRAEAEARRNIVLNPFRFRAGDDRARDHEAIAQGLARGLASPVMPALPGKFGFVVDVDMRLRHLAAVSGDIRIEGAAGHLIVRTDGAAMGRKVADEGEAVALALKLARWFAESGGIGADGRGRMRHHLANGARLPQDLSGDLLPNSPASPAHPGAYACGVCVGAGFGQLPAHRLGWLADRAPAGVFVTPFRMLYLPHPVDITQIEVAEELVTAPGDPQMRVFACTGAPGCPQALSATRELARVLARHVPTGRVLHVSGCGKGCAHSGPADITLTATAPDCFDLIRDGRASDGPGGCGLTAAQLTQTPDLLTESP
ncbi:precorrin-3B synthase [Actibacterium sp. D379-3]